MGQASACRGTRGSVLSSGAQPPYTPPSRSRCSYAPVAAESVNIYYTKLHTLDATSSTLPSRFEDVVAAGAAAYAALEWASFATNRVNVGGQDVWRDYLAWGQERLAEFESALAKYGRRNAVRVRQLHRPATTPVDQSTVTGP